MTSTIKVNNVQNQCGQNIINENSNTITIGASGDTIALASGASQTGFGRTGTVDWDTTPKTATFSAVSGNGYFVNTTAGVITVNLPAGSAGAIVSLADYAATWQTNNVTVSPDGTDKIGSVNANVTLNTEGQSVTFVYVDSTQGWVNTMDSTSNVRGNPFIEATGGTITCCGDYKIHSFTGPGTFTVTNAGTPAGSNTVDYLVVAGGGAGASSYRSGGGGAGGVRFSATTYCEPSPATPLKAPAALPVSAQGYPITLGAGSVKEHISSPPDARPVRNPNGSPSIFSTIVSAGGGSGGEYPAVRTGGPGGSGGGGNGNPSGPGAQAGGTGNTPPVSPAQGNNGGAGGIASSEAPGTGGASRAGGGGGGALTVGSSVSPAPDGDGGPGGNGITLNIIGSCSSYGGGGGGGAYTQPYPTAPAPGGTGGGGVGAGRSASNYVNNSTSGTANTGGGGGGNSAPGLDVGVSPGNGGSGIVIIRYKFQ